jgi:hypothetical protein
MFQELAGFEFEKQGNDPRQELYSCLISAYSTNFSGEFPLVVDGSGPFCLVRLPAVIQ